MRGRKTYNVAMLFVLALQHVCCEYLISFVYAHFFFFFSFSGALFSFYGACSFVYLLFVYSCSFEVCGCPNRLLTEPYGGSCQTCESDKIRDAVENIHNL